MCGGRGGGNVRATRADRGPLVAAQRHAAPPLNGSSLCRNDTGTYLSFITSVSDGVGFNPQF